MNIVDYEIAISPAKPIELKNTEPYMHQRLQRVCAETPIWLQAAGVPGLTVGLLDDGKLSEVLCFGTTTPHSDVPITEETIFEAHSLSKQAFLFAVLATIDAGKIDVDRPLSQYSHKPFPADDIDINRITARHVLTHTSGWNNWPIPEGTLITRMSPLGKRWTYSGMGFEYLLAAMESIWNEPAVDLLRRLVLEPLDMRRSNFVWREEYNRTAVDGFYKDGTVGNIWGPSEPAEPSAAGSLHTTATEYAHLMEAFLAGDLRQRHPDVYRRQVEINDELGWSLGWGTANDILWQWGDGRVFHNFAAIAPARGLGIVVMTNGERGQRICREWVNAWLETDLPAFFLKCIPL